MTQPLISVIIVVYNAKDTLRHTIESVLQQTYSNIELVIIDGGSTDGSLQIIKNYSPSIQYFISEKDNGIYDAMNKGIKAAKGDWMIFLGADDVFYTNNTVEDIFTKNELHNIEFLYGDVEFKSSKKRFGEEKNYKKIIERNLCHQGIFYHKNIFSKLGLYNLRYPIVADHDMNLRIFRDTRISKKYVTPIITVFNDKGTSDSVIDRNFAGDMLFTFLEKEKIPFFAPELQLYHFYYGIISLITHKYAPAIRHIPVSWVSGKRKLFYFLFTGKFILKLLFRKKIKLK